MVTKNCLAGNPYKYLVHKMVPAAVPWDIESIVAAGVTDLFICGK